MVQDNGYIYNYPQSVILPQSTGSPAITNLYKATIQYLQSIYKELVHKQDYSKRIKRQHSPAGQHELSRRLG